MSALNPLRLVEVNHFDFFHPQIPPALEGFSLAQISDIHMGRWVKPRHMRQVVDFINDLDPHLVALTGDYVGYNKLDFDRCVQTLDALHPPTYAVLGNHDHWTDSALAKARFGRSGIDLLQNESRTISHHDAHFHLVGVDDAVTKNADLAKAFAGAPTAQFCLTLNHVPAIAPDCAKAGADLILSGHTHNFQFNIPKLTNALAKALGTQFYAGPYRLDQSFLYINRGLGSASWPWRIRATPELTLFTLRHGPTPSLDLTASDPLRVIHKP